MNDFEEKYGVIEDKNTENFHRNRRMFCISNGRLYIAKPNLPYSHAAWFKNKGWMDEEHDEFMEKSVRGYVIKDNEIRFYVGYDFRVTKEAEDEFFEHLNELVNKLNIRAEVKVLGGQVKTKDTVWPAEKYYGTVEELLSNVE